MNVSPIGFPNWFAICLAVIFLSAPAPACSVCGCSLSDDWAFQGFHDMPGSDFTTRFEYYDQTQLRQGTRVLDRKALDLPDEAEIQQETLTRSYWMSYDSVIAPHFGLTAEVPYYSRFHTTIAPNDTQTSVSRANGLGDARVLARFQSRALDTGWTVQIGLKLPTGKINQTFAEGPQKGELLDRGLQLGTGSTDVLVSVTYFRRVGTRFGTFAQTLVAQPVTRKDEFWPGSAVNFNAGIRYLNTSRFTPQVQVNARCEGREHGKGADFDNSGASILDLSPGATVELTRKTAAFVFVQIPMIQRVNGRQLEPRWLLSSGLRWQL